MPSSDKINEKVHVMSCPTVLQNKMILEKWQATLRELVNPNTVVSYAEEKDASDDSDGEAMGEGQ